MGESFRLYRRASSCLKLGGALIEREAAPAPRFESLGARTHFYAAGSCSSELIEVISWFTTLSVLDTTH
jgi:hypothetical protein